MNQEASGVAVESSEGKEVAWGWYLVLGIALVMLGTIAISMPFITTVAVNVLLGWILIFGGIVQMIYSFFARKEGNFGMMLLLGALYLLFGILVVNNVAAATIAITSLIAIFFLVEGIIKFVMAFEVKPAEGWGWMLTGGIISIVFALLILTNLLASSIILVGLLVGLNLLFGGIAMITSAFLVKRKGEGSGWMLFWIIMLVFFIIFITLRMMQ